MSRAVSAILDIPAMTIVIACGAFASYAQEGELPATDGAFFYALSVRNIDEAVAWYMKHLGFKLESQGGNDQRRGALLSRPGAVLELGEFAGAVAPEEIRTGLSLMRYMASKRLTSDPVERPERPYWKGSGT